MWELSVLSLQLFCVQKLFSNLNCIQTSKPSVTRRPNQAPRDSLTVNERGSKGQSRSLNTGWVRNMRLSLTCPSLPSPGHPIQRALELMTLKMWGGGRGGTCLRAATVQSQAPTLPSRLSLISLTTGRGSVQDTPASCCVQGSWCCPLRLREGIWRLEIFHS